MLCGMWIKSLHAARPKMIFSHVKLNLIEDLTYSWYICNQYMTVEQSFPGSYQRYMLNYVCQKSSSVQRANEYWRSVGAGRRASRTYVRSMERMHAWRFSYGLMVRRCCPLCWSGGGGCGSGAFPIELVEETFIPIVIIIWIHAIGH